MSGRAGKVDRGKWNEETKGRERQTGREKGHIFVVITWGEILNNSISEGKGGRGLKKRRDIGIDGGGMEIIEEIDRKRKSGESHVPDVCGSI